MQDMNEELQIRACVQKFNAERKFYRRRAELINLMSSEERGFICWGDFWDQVPRNVEKYLRSISADAGAEINLKRHGVNE